MYTIIYWTDDSSVFPVLNDDGTLKLFDRVVDAEDYGDKSELDDYRIISIETVLI